VSVVGTKEVFVDSSVITLQQQLCTYEVYVCAMGEQKGHYAGEPHLLPIFALHDFCSGTVQLNFLLTIDFEQICSITLSILENEF
jgi:hypothetical protein